MLAVLAVLAGLLPGTASADPQRGAIVVEGAGNRSVIVDIPPHKEVQTPFPVLTGGDGYAGVVVERLQESGYELVFAAAAVRAFRDETAQAQAFHGAGQFSPGRYRLTLLGDAPVRAEWQMNFADDPGVHVVPRTEVAARFLGRAEPLASGLSEARVDLPRALPAGRRVLQMMLLTGTHADAPRMCATTAEECPRSLLPVCLPAPAPCSPVDSPPLPTWRSTGEPTMAMNYSPVSAEVRALRWSVEGFREEPDRLRAAAIVF